MAGSGASSSSPMGTVDVTDLPDALARRMIQETHARNPLLTEYMLSQTAPCARPCACR